MDADRPDSVTNDFKTNSETIGGNGVVAAAPLKAPANGSNVSASLANDNGCVVVDKTIGGIRQPQSVESHSDTILSNDVLSVSPAAAAAVANAAAAAAASDNDTNVCDPNGRFSSVMSDCNRTIKRQSFGMANGCAAVEVRVSSVLPSSVATAAPATVQNHSIETDRVSADDDVRDDAQTISQATTINGVHANQTAKDISYGNSKEQHQQQSANAFDSSEKNGSTAMYQRIPSDEEDADRKRAARTNGFMRTARRSPSTRNKKRTANGSAYNSLTHLDNDSDNEAGAGDRGSKHALYNEYVNLLCDADISTVAANDAARKRGQPNDRRHDGPAHGATENKPLLLDLAGQSSSSVHRKPKSIVKSPSFSSADRYFDGNRKPRLSIQCSGNDPERPVLHVQFLPNQTKSTTAMTQSYPPQMDAAHSSNVIRQGSLDTDGGGAGGLSSVRSSVSSTGSSSSDDSSSESSSSDEDSSIGQIAEAKPPDGGWGWVVVFASFMVNLIADGITFSFGVIYVEFLNYFGEGKAKTAWIGSLFMAMPLLSGPVASFLTDRYGCRRVTIAGSILASLGFFISAFTNTMEMLFLTFGILAGFGLSLCYVAAVVIVAYYFDKRRSFATGLSVCGSGIGTFIFAPLTQLLIDEYGWRGTTLILSGLFLNMCVCGMLMRDLEWTTYRAKLRAKQRKKRNRLGISAESFSASNSTNTAGTTSNTQNNHDSNGGDDETTGHALLINGGDVRKSDPRLFSSLITLPTFVKTGEKVPMEVLELMSSNKNIHNVLLQNYPGLAHSRSFSQPLAMSRHSTSDGIPLEHNSSADHTFNPSNTMSPESNTSTTNPARIRHKSSSKSRTIRDEQAFLNWLKDDQNPRRPKGVQLMLNHRNPPTSAYLKDLRMHRHSLTYRGAMLNINRYRLRASSCPDIYRNSMTTIAKEKTQFRQGVEEFKEVVMDMLDFSYFMDPRFLLFAISNFFLYTWYDVPYVYLADYAIEMEFNESDASILISLIGIVNMVGEIILGWSGDRKFISASMIYAICMLFCGLVTGLVPLLKTYAGLSVVSGLFGLFIAANYALTSIILVELITLDRFTNAYGLLLLVQGIANLVGPPLAGWITDITGSYDLAFYLAGVFISVSGVLMLVLPAHGKYRKYCEIRRRSSAPKSSSFSDRSLNGDVESNAIPTPNAILASKSALKMNGNAKSCLGPLSNDATGKNDGLQINHV